MFYPLLLHANLTTNMTFIMFVFFSFVFIIFEN